MTRLLASTRHFVRNDEASSKCEASSNDEAFSKCEASSQCEAQQRAMDRRSFLGNEVLAKLNGVRCLCNVIKLRVFVIANEVKQSMETREDYDFDPELPGIRMPYRI